MTETFDGRRVDICALRRMLRQTALEIIELKRPLRQRWLRPMAAEQRALAALKNRATRLCVLRAFLRQRYHLARPPRSLDPSAWDVPPPADPGSRQPLAARATYHRDVAARTADRYALYLPADQTAPGATL